MKKGFYPVVAFALAVIFAAGSLFCCCISRVVKDNLKKASCCHTPLKSEKKPCIDHCSSLAKMAETAKAFDLAPAAGVSVIPATVSAFSLPSLRFVRNASVHAPPPIAAGPALYTLFHSLRI